MRALEAKLAAEIQTKASLSENLKETKGEIRRRDETIANIAGRIVQEFGAMPTPYKLSLWKKDTFRLAIAISIQVLEISLNKFQILRNRS